MDYKRYPALMLRYKQLEKLSIGPQDTRKTLIQKLTDISREKKQILVEANAILQQWVATYEKQPDALDGPAAAMLEDFLALLRPAEQDLVDPSISLRIARLLLGYYQSVQDPEKVIAILQQCAYFDLTLKEHRDDYDSTPYALMAEGYMGQVDRLSDDGICRLVHCLTLGGYNRKDLTFGLRKYMENRAAFSYIYQKLGEDNLAIQEYYAMFKSNALGYALLACLLTEDAENRGAPLAQPFIDLETYAPIMEEFVRELKAILESDRAKYLLSDRVTIQFAIAQTDYHMGRISLEELLARMERYMQPKEDDTPYERGLALLTGWPCYLDYLCRCGRFDRQYIQNRSTQVIGYVLSHAEEGTRDLSAFFTTYFTNRAVLQMISTASGFLDFDYFKSVTLSTTIYANKELYVHTMMVKEICVALLGHILDHDPQYLDGVAGYGWQYCRDHKGEILALMEDCALLHDIGKYFCLDIVNNASRALTDDEFDIIKEHPTNFSKIYQGPMSPRMQCIRDCAELHHLWYDGAGGYPRREHTVNKPFVNILTIADCIDAATDTIGRPYGLGKTLDQVMAEFDAGRDTRYSGYVSDILHQEDIRRWLEYVICDRRQDIYCGLYLHHN